MDSLECDSAHAVPEHFKIGDVVEAQLNVIAIRNAEGVFHMKIVLRSLLRVEDVHRRVRTLRLQYLHSDFLSLRSC